MELVLLLSFKSGHRMWWQACSSAKKKPAIVGDVEQCGLFCFR